MSDTEFGNHMEFEFGDDYSPEIEYERVEHCGVAPYSNDPEHNYEGMFLLKQDTKNPMEYLTEFNNQNIITCIKMGCISVDSNKYLGQISNMDMTRIKVEDIPFYKLLIEYDLIYCRNLENKNEFINLFLEGMFILSQDTKIPMEHRIEFNNQNIPTRIKLGCISLFSTYLLAAEISDIIDIKVKDIPFYKLLLEYDLIYCANLEMKKKYIDALKTTIYLEPIEKSLEGNKVCSISHNEIVPGNTYMICTECSNNFNYQQINEWLSINNSCPNCRTYWNNNKIYIIPRDEDND